jgi:hypothetical protein
MTRVSAYLIGWLRWVNGSRHAEYVSELDAPSEVKFRHRRKL